uniref:Cation:proton antiporter n=1 Tax=candidate division WOR-3 bacterium TaxID=2052148 RepID=A0A7V0Z5P4_UNCW3
MSLIVRCITNITSGFIFMYGIYIILHGHLTPGGGFAGGVIIAGALILRVLAFGSGIDKEKKSALWSSIFESIGGLIFWGAAFTGLLVAGVFFLNAPIFGLGKPLHLLSAGLIPICNIGIGIKVGAGLFSIFLVLAGLKYIMED